MANIKHQSILKLKDTQFFELLIKELVTHGIVKVTGLGVFKLKNMKEQNRYIPGKGEMGIVKARVKLVFLPTKSIKENIQKYAKSNKIPRI